MQYKYEDQDLTLPPIFTPQLRSDRGSIQLGHFIKQSYMPIFLNVA